ncbi:MAG TPA: ribosomal protein L7/L12 [Myxococcaceae bacterium]|jgi:hypothetical protein
MNPALVLGATNQTPYVCMAVSLGILALVLVAVLLPKKEPQRTAQELQALKNVPESAMKQARKLIREGTPLQAVRLLNETSKLSLVDANAYVDAFQAVELGKLSFGEALTVETACEVRELLQKGERLQAIRLLVSRTGASQPEAQRLVELLAATRDNQGWVARQPLPQAITPEQLQEVRDLAAKGNKIEAIKEYRHLTGAGLKEAKDYVESLENQ